MARKKKEVVVVRPTNLVKMPAKDVSDLINAALVGVRNMAGSEPIPDENFAKLGEVCKAMVEPLEEFQTQCKLTPEEIIAVMLGSCKYIWAKYISGEINKL